MLRRISAMKARQNLGQIMNEVNLRNDKYIIERNGRPVAALIPVWLLLNLQKRTESFLSILNKHRDSQDELSEEETQILAKEAIEAARKQKRK